MKNKGWLLLLLGAGAAYFLYQKTAQAREQSSADQKAYFERLRQAAIRQRQVEALRNQVAHTAVISPEGNIAPPPVQSGPLPKDLQNMVRPGGKFGPEMVM